MPSRYIEKMLNYWLIIAGILWGVIGVLSICPAGGVIAFFDQPSPNWNANYFFIFSVISFPIVCIISSLGIWIFRNKYKRLALSITLLPILPILLIFIGGAWMNLSSCGKADCSTPTFQEQAGNAQQIGICTSPILDGGDGLTTTGCGILDFGTSVTGATKSLSEAHNWQFSVQDGHRLAISIASNGVCPQIHILDSSNQFIKAFEEENRYNYSDICLGGTTIETIFYYFNPPANGTYVIRVVTPNNSGEYVLKIE
jgi:hypothetical protein